MGLTILEGQQKNRVVLWLVGTAALVLLWFLYAGKVNEQEALIGAAGILLTVLALISISREHFAPFAPRGRWLAQAAKLPWQVVKDTASVLSALPRGLSAGDKPVGKFSSAPFPAGGADAESSAKRALAVGLSSFPPNSILLDVEREENKIVYHELVPTGSTPEPAGSLSKE